ncbi:MAG: hypothetical protein GX581_11405 [Syntrophomonadaceae bacterium]|nr:hypothetical protein [Syntrophomonadaceae bacterium]
MIINISSRSSHFHHRCLFFPIDQEKSKSRHQQQVDSHKCTKYTRVDEAFCHVFLHLSPLQFITHFKYCFNLCGTIT